MKSSAGAGIFLILGPDYKRPVVAIKWSVLLSHDETRFRGGTDVSSRPCIFGRPARASKARYKRSLLEFILCQLDAQATTSEWPIARGSKP